jgi:DtxR family Mn-dependent transcriptional regulator
MLLAPDSPVAPLTALAVFAVAAVFAALLFWPRRGLVAWAIRFSRRSDRVLLEDALKQLHHAESAGRPGTIESLAGGLEVARGSVVRLIERLAELGLVRPEDGQFSLTPDGRAHALHLVRAHRLWERYLADRTGVLPAEWHEQAEAAEHVLSEVEAEALSARMNHPRYDPHGDPIPTHDGELPARASSPLSVHRPGTALTILHLEDEPRESFERLLALGLTPGTPIRLLSVSPTQVRFRLDGREHTLPPVVADQISVEPLGDGQELDEALRVTLAEVPPGASARVVRIAAHCQGPARRRLLDLGIVPGALIGAEFASPGGDPVAYRVRGALIALRRIQAELIQVEAGAPVEAAT